MNSKIGGIAAAFGFVLSLIIGLIFGNGTFAIVRALVFAVFFFVLVNILLVIIRRFLPELLDFDTQPEGDSRPGSKINIIAGDSPGAMLGGKAGLESLGSRQGQDAEDIGSIAEPDLSSERFSYNDYAGGNQDNISGALPNFGGAPLSGLNGSLPDDVSAPVPALDQRGEDGYNGKRNVSDLGTESQAARTGGAAFSPRPVPREDAALPNGNSSVDVLPDFEAMSQAFLASTREPGPDETKDKTTGQTEDVFRLSVTGQEPDPSSQYYTGNKPVEMEGDFPPKQLAQAIQTVLKRDEQ
ncbi:MAG: hypothetical protein LBB83_10330 [Treponema sp.]|jgi:hypothetical protein|nr:hypothetical protein [Treponema sp.]